MKISESARKELKSASSAIQSVGSGVRLASQRLNTLNMGNDPKEEESQEDSGTGFDPTRYMSREEERLWNQLSVQKQNVYIREGMRQAEREMRADPAAKRSRDLFRRDLNHLEERKRQRVRHQDERSRKCWGSGREGREGREAVGDVPEQPGAGNYNGRQAVTDSPGEATIGGVPNVTINGTVGNMSEGTSGSVTAGISGSSSAGMSQAASGAASAGTGVATGGVPGVVLAAAKKTAETFRDAVEAHTISANQQLQRRADELRAGSAMSDSAFLKGGAAVAAMLLAAASVLAQMAAMLVTSVLIPVIILIAIVVIVVTMIAAVAAVIISIVMCSATSGNGAERIVQVALAEEGTNDGSKYWEYVMGSRFVDGSATPWCACFVSWCANECGFIEDGTFPKSASVAVYKSYYSERNLYHEADGYTPRQGDLIIFGGTSHIGIVQYSEGGRVVTIEGNTSDAVHSRSYSLNSSYITGYCTPEYPAGETIEIPEGMGVYHTYMGWSTVTSRTSLQYRLKVESGEHYDEEGFAMIDGRYVIACTTTFGSVGDYVDFYREDGSIIHAVIGDIKNRNDSGCNEYGHANGRCVVEYVVQQSMWYPSHPNPGTAGCHPEWNSRVVRAVNLGRNFFD